MNHQVNLELSVDFENRIFEKVEETVCEMLNGEGEDLLGNAFDVALEKMIIRQTKHKHVQCGYVSFVDEFIADDGAINSWIEKRIEQAIELYLDEKIGKRVDELVDSLLDLKNRK